MTLAEFIDKHFQLCSYRGIDPLNPIDFIIQPVEGVAETWTLLCSVSEPTFSRVAYNILWMPLNPIDPNYRKVLRRTDHETSTAPYKSAWIEITDYDMLWEEPQYWIPVVTDPNLLGIETPNENIGPATTTILGLAYLEPNLPDSEDNVDPVSPIGVEKDDLRMFNDRYPNFHTHPDYARTMIKINATQYARVDTSYPPEDGMLLFLDAINPDNANEFLAVWRYPRSNDIAFVDRSLLSIEIVGPTVVQEQTTEQYEVLAHFADGSSRTVVPSIFENELNTSAASINISGLLTTNNISVNTPIRLAASYTHLGVTRSATLNVNVVAGIEVTALEILGADEVTENTTSNVYSVRATFSDNSQSIVTPLTFVTNSPALVSINPNRSLTVGEVDSATPTMLTATYSFGGATATATKQVTVVEAPVVPQSLAIIGPSPATIMEGESFVFTFRVTYSDGSIEVYNTTNIFASENTTVFAVNQNGGVATGTAGSVTTNTTVRLNASYIEGGITLSDSMNLTVTDVAQPTGAEIYNGLTDFFEDQPQVFRSRIRFDNNTTLAVSDSTRTVWSIVNGGTHASITEHPTDGSATLVPNNITANQTVRIRVVATYNGVDYAVEQNLTIRARLNTPNSLKIFEATVPPANYDGAVTSIDVNAGTTEDFKLAAKMSFTPTQWTAIPANSGQVTFSIASPAYGITAVVDPANTNNILISVPLSLDQNRTVQLVASYVNDGGTANASYTINAKAINTDISPRFGMAPQQNLKADYATPAFYDMLTGSLTGVNNETFTTGASVNMQSLAYIMYPKSWGYIYIVNTGNNVAGSWDGAGTTASDGTFNSAEEVTVNGKQYYVYRVTFPYGPAITWRISYGSSVPDSSIP